MYVTSILIHACIHKCIYDYIHSKITTCIHSYVLTCVETRKHNTIHAYMHIYTQVSVAEYCRGSVHSLEVVGGGVRVPAVQEALETVFGRKVSEGGDTKGRGRREGEEGGGGRDRLCSKFSPRRVSGNNS